MASIRRNTVCEKWRDYRNVHISVISPHVIDLCKLTHGCELQVKARGTSVYLEAAEHIPRALSTLTCTQDIVSCGSVRMTVKLYTVASCSLIMYSQPGKYIHEAAKPIITFLTWLWAIIMHSYMHRFPPHTV